MLGSFCLLLNFSYHTEFEASMGRTRMPHGEGALHHSSLLYPSLSRIMALASVNLCNFTDRTQRMLIAYRQTRIFERFVAGMFAAC